MQGATAAGKSAVAVKIAAHFGCVVLSADSRQFYKEMSIGTAVPTSEELATAHHYFIQDRSVTEPLSAGAYGDEARTLIAKLSEGKGEDEIVAVVVGGSGLYVDALLYGLDPIPSDDKIREQLNKELDEKGLVALIEELKRVDEESFNTIELTNPQRVVRALEVCRLSGKKFSSFKSGERLSQLNHTKIIVDMPREELYDRINLRVDEMVRAGLEGEVRALLEHRNLSALQTVGYSELFEYFDGDISFDRAIELIKQHSRNYAKRQVTWLRRDTETPRFSPYNIDEIIDYLY